MTSLHTAFALACAAVLATAALGKLRSRSNQSRLLLEAIGIPSRVARTVAPAAIPIELMVGLTLSLGVLPLATSTVAAALGIVFLGVQLRSFHRGVNLRCACFGSAGFTEIRAFGALRALIVLVTALAAATTAPGSMAGSAPILSAPWGPLAALCTAALLLALTLAEQVVYFEQHRVRPLPEAAR